MRTTSYFALAAGAEWEASVMARVTREMKDCGGAAPADRGGRVTVRIPREPKVV